MTHKAQVAVVEHHGLMRRGLVDLLSTADGLDVVAAVSEPEELLTLDPPVDVITYGPAPANTGRLVESVTSLTASGRVLLVAESGVPGLSAEVLGAGAYGCVTRHSDDDVLIAAVRTVAQGGLYLSPEFAPRLHADLREPPAGPTPVLARREIQTVRWIAAGLTHGQVARRMNLTEATVSTYVKRIRNKLNVGNKADLTRRAIELGLLDDSPDDGARRTPHHV
ncbi:LuxR C-terminal-related transcriptional regulator [Streptomyces sp. CA-111067]|uniref:LuxR C-terminal-related transcriptional regulator n=1 Tax=Streptomyces sp. CA-111067 TaxID=3240046 RepID=UPI003D980E16